MNNLREAMRNALIEFHYYCFKQHNVCERFLCKHWFIPKTNKKLILFASKSKNQGLNRLYREKWETNIHNKEQRSNKQNILKVLSWYWSSRVPVRKAEKPHVFIEIHLIIQNREICWEFFFCFFIKIYSQICVI